MPLNILERVQWNVARMLNPSLVADLSIVNQELKLDSDAPFRATGVAVYVVGNTAGNQNITLRFTRADGNWVQKLLTSAQSLNPFQSGAIAGAGGQTAPFYSYFAPLAPNLLYPASSSILIDYEDLTGNALVMVVFVGTKLFSKGITWSPTYPAKYTARPYLGYALQFATTTLPVYDLPLNINPDADFVWQAGAQTDQPVTGTSPVAAERFLGVKIKDWVGKYYMNDYVPAELIFGFDNVQMPGLVYPEIYIPKNQAIYFDFVEL